MRNLIFTMLLLTFTTISFSQEHFKVETDQEWQNTGYSIVANQPLALAVIGYLNNNSDANNRRFNYYGPTGNINAGGGSNLPLETSPSGSLIGKIGENGDPFGVGEFVIFADGGQNPLTETGELYLRVNDANSNLGDNDGTFVVWIIPLLSVDQYIVETDQDWQNTGSNILANEPLALRAIGYLNNNSDANNRRFNYYGPTGNINAGGGSNLPLETSPSGSLIGKIGENGDPFGVGEFVIFADGGQNPLTETGELYLRVNDANSNLSDNEGKFFIWIMKLDGSTSIKEISSINKITITPNPSREKINVSIKSNHSENYNIEIYSINGQLVFLTNESFNENKTIDVSSMLSGTYFIKILTSDGIVIGSKKFVKE